MKPTKNLFTSALFAVLLGLSNFASANIIGDSVNVTHYYPDAGTINADMGTQIVPTGVFDYYGAYQIQVFGDYLIYSSNTRNTSFGGAAFNGPVITDLSSVFTNATIDASSAFSGFDATRLTFDNNHIYLNMQGLALSGYLRIDFDSQSSAVPEPASIALIGMGLLGFASVRRKSYK